MANVRLIEHMSAMGLVTDPLITPGTGRENGMTDKENVAGSVNVRLFEKN